MKLDLIYTKDEMLVSNKHKDWRAWQDKFDNYMASLSFQDLDELVEFLKIEYKLDTLESKLLDNVLSTSDSDLFILELPENKDGKIILREFN